VTAVRGKETDAGCEGREGVTDPVTDGRVARFAHPGRNLTGIADTDFELLPKALEIFKKFLAHQRRLLVLLDSRDPATARLLANARQAAITLRLRLVEREAKTGIDVERVFGALKRGDVSGVFIVSPTSFHRKEWVAQGALFSYGYDFVAVGRAAAHEVRGGDQPDHRHRGAERASSDRSPESARSTSAGRPSRVSRWTRENVSS
jgi:hypothetical protein